MSVCLFLLAFVLVCLAFHGTSRSTRVTCWLAALLSLSGSVGTWLISSGIWKI